MNLLAALVRAYDVRSGMPPINYSSEKVSYLIPLQANGDLSGPPVDLRRSIKKNATPITMSVPSGAKRTSAIVPNFLWDKTSYALGISENASERTNIEHEKFVQWHAELLSQSCDTGLRAFLDFLLKWKVTNFATLGWPQDMLDQNIVFGLGTERDGHGAVRGIHDRPAARELWGRIQESRQSNFGTCSITGTTGAIARLHPPIKGVPGAQASGALLVSFNKDAFCSYRRLQGDNAPISEAAAFKYGTVLNHLLAYGSRNKIQLGDLTLVFWANGPEAIAIEAEELFYALADNPNAEPNLAALRPELRDISFAVVGISSNAARLSVRFQLTKNFQQVVANLVAHYRLTRIQHSASAKFIPMRTLLTATAPFGQEDRIASAVASHFLQATLTGEAFPAELLYRTIMRLQSEKRITVACAALLKAVLSRNSGIHLGYCLDADLDDHSYLLGRLLAWFDFLEQEARGGGIGVPVSSVHYASASANPAQTFPALHGKALRNLEKIRPRKPALISYAEACLLDLISKAFNWGKRKALPSPEDRAVFAIGCYHQRQELYLSGESRVLRTGQEALNDGN